VVKHQMASLNNFHTSLRCVASLIAKLSFALLASFASAATLAYAAPDCPPPFAPPTQEQIKQASGTAKDRGLLWSITKDGRTSYLFGTMHVGKLEWSMPGPQFIAALKNTNKMALELNMSDPNTLQQMQSPDTSSLPQVTVSDAQRVQLEQLKRDACMPQAMAPAVEKMHPLSQVMSLSLLHARKQQLEIAYASEIVLMGIAAQLKREMVGLETPKQQMQALLGTDSKQAQQLFDEALQDKHTADPARMLTRMADGWSQSKLDDLEKFDDWCECRRTEAERALMTRMIDERNPLMARRIDELHVAGDKLFVAVGMGHMVGKLALPKLMKQQGYEVKQLVPAP
jgi:uncharacterized protein